MIPGCSVCSKSTTFSHISDASIILLMTMKMWHIYACFLDVYMVNSWLLYRLDYVLLKQIVLIWQKIQIGRLSTDVAVSKRQVHWLIGLI